MCIVVISFRINPIQFISLGGLPSGCSTPPPPFDDISEHGSTSRRHYDDAPSYSGSSSRTTNNIASHFIHNSSREDSIRWVGLSLLHRNHPIYILLSCISIFWYLFDPNVSRASFYGPIYGQFTNCAYYLELYRPFKAISLAVTLGLGTFS